MIYGISLMNRLESGARRVKTMSEAVIIHDNSRPSENSRWGERHIRGDNTRSWDNLGWFKLDRPSLFDRKSARTFASANFLNLCEKTARIADNSNRRTPGFLFSSAKGQL